MLKILGTLGKIMYSAPYWVGFTINTNEVNLVNSAI